jgi:subtilase family serine protease
MKKILITLIILISLDARGQDFSKNFKFLLNKNDTAGQMRLLKEWESQNPRDPELYIAYFNYYANASMKGMTFFGKNRQNDSSLILTDSI